VSTLFPDAAEEFFARKGFDGAALDDIADAVGYTRGAIYAHFGSKEEGDYITEGVARLGGTLHIPAMTLARVLLATNEGITLSSHLDGEDLYRPWLLLVISCIGPSPQTA
jgi:AcrR family transcriptional regulator